MEWLRYEGRVIFCAWQELRKDMNWSVRSFIRTGIEFAVLLVLLWLALGDTEFREEVGLLGVGFAAAVATPAILFIFHWLRAPYLVHAKQAADSAASLAALQASVRQLENTVRIYTETPEDVEKIEITQALQMLPEQDRIQLFREGAYKRLFDVFGKEMRQNHGQKTLLFFDTGDRQYKKISGAYWETAALVVDGLDSPTQRFMAVDGEIKPFTCSDDGSPKTRYTDLMVGKEKFELYAKQH